MFNKVTPPLALQHVALNCSLTSTIKMSVSPLNFGNKPPPEVQLACAAEQGTQSKHQQTREHTRIIDASEVII